MRNGHYIFVKPKMPLGKDNYTKDNAIDGDES